MELPARGIIPARAGFTTSDDNQPERNADHPRSRGVYYGVRAVRTYVVGSSPLVRGLPMHRPYYCVPRGIIPARAGFTTGITCTCSAPGDHPRSRGVYRLIVVDSGNDEGSSPLARGLPTDDDHLLTALGIIPARAGFTRWRRSCRRRPRGSSPLARGLHVDADAYPRLVGIIPARAGFTRTARTRRSPCRDHLRSRGVYPLKNPRSMT